MIYAGYNLVFAFCLLDLSMNNKQRGTLKKKCINDRKDKHTISQIVQCFI